MNNIIIFYHNADFDGMCSNNIIVDYYENNIKPKINSISIGINYNNDLEETLNKHELSLDDIYNNNKVYIVDFSFDYRIMKLLKEKIDPDNLIWIDHHKTAIDNSIIHNYNNIKGVRNDKTAACELVWEYFHPNTEVPIGVDYLASYDIWDHSDIYVLYFQYGARKYLPKDYNTTWYEMFDNQTDILNKILSYGKLIYEYECEQNKRIAKSISYTINFHGHRALVANRGHISSKFFDSIYDPNKHDIFIKYYLDKSNKYFVSLYTSKDIDLTNIAKYYNGGGHPHACGFQLDNIDILRPSN